MLAAESRFAILERQIVIVAANGVSTFILVLTLN
jgi:hypothetical protein